MMIQRLPLASGFTALALLVLAGCTAPQDRIDTYRARCMAYGLAPESEALAQCVGEEARNERLQGEIRRSSMMNDPFFRPPPVIVVRPKQE